MIRIVSAGLALVFLLLTGQAVIAAKRPFPFQASYASGIIKPSHVSLAQMNNAVRQHYAAWKAKYLRDLGGDYWVKYDASNSTVSEAHGYGMVLTAYMGDRAIFNSMLRYFKAHPSHLSPHLMAWKQTYRNSPIADIAGADALHVAD